MKRSRNTSDPHVEKQRRREPKPERRSDRLRATITPVITLLILTGIWLIVTEGGLIEAYLLPSPRAVVSAFLSDFDILLYHSHISLQEALLGLAIGVLLAWVFALLMDAIRLMREALYPLLVISQTIPTIAIAPLLVIWMGFGIAPKVALVVLTSFFPIVIGLLGAFDAVDPDEIHLLQTMGANPIQTFRHTKLPASMEAFFSALRVSASYAIVTAVVAEWLGGFEGLGVYMTRVRQAYAFDKMFAVIVLISALSLALVGIVEMLQWLCLPWKRIKN